MGTFGTIMTMLMTGVLGAVWYHTRNGHYYAGESETIFGLVNRGAGAFALFWGFALAILFPMMPSKSNPNPLDAATGNLSLKIYELAFGAAFLITMVVLILWAGTHLVRSLLQSDKGYMLTAAVFLAGSGILLFIWNQALF